MAEEGANNQEKVDAGGSGKNPLLTIVMILNIVLLGGVIYMQLETHKKMNANMSEMDLIKADMTKASEDGEEATVAVPKEDQGNLLPLDGFTANLAQGDGPRRFIRLNAVLKLSSDAKDEEYKARKPQIRDAIISILNAKRPEDLLKVQGKEHLKEEIKAAINTFLVEGRVLDVYYVGFQIN